MTMSYRFSFFQAVLIFLQEKTRRLSTRVFCCFASKCKPVVKVVSHQFRTKKVALCRSIDAFAAEKKTFTENELEGLLLADVAALFFSPFVTAFLFEPNFENLSSGFLLKIMVVFVLITIAVLISCGLYRNKMDVFNPFQGSKKQASPLLRAHTPTLARKTIPRKSSEKKALRETHAATKISLTVTKRVLFFPQNLKALLAYVIAGNVLTYPFEQMVSQLEHLSPVTLLLNVSLSYLLLLPQRFFLLFLHVNDRSTKQAKDAKIFPIVANEPVSVLLVGSLQEVESFVKNAPKNPANQRFVPIAAVTPDTLDFGLYIEDVPIVGDVHTLPELVKAEGKCPSFQCLFLLDNSVPSETLFASRAIAQEKGVSILTMKSPGKVASIF